MSRLKALPARRRDRGATGDPGFRNGAVDRMRAIELLRDLHTGRDSLSGREARRRLGAHSRDERRRRGARTSPVWDADELRRYLVRRQA